MNGAGKRGRRAAAGADEDVDALAEEEEEEVRGRGPGNGPGRPSKAAGKNALQPSRMFRQSLVPNL